MTMTLGLSFSFAKAMYDTQVNTMDHNLFWKRCLISGTLARALAEKMAQPKPERFFLAGLIQDIGMLALNELESDTYGVLFHSASDHRELASFETSEFSADHAEAGAWLLSQWGMPDFYVQQVKSSHQSCNKSLSEETVIIPLSGLFAELWVRNERAQVMAELIEIGKSCNLFDNKEINDIVDRVSAQLPDLNAIFETNLSTNFSTSSLIEEGKQQLVTRNLKLIQDLAQAQSDACAARADQEKLKEQLKRDILTGVFNRAYIESISERAFYHAKERASPLTVMFLDIDHFKEVNDRYGHQAGDKALKHFARILVNTTGKGYYVGRYGGEEFVVIMPGMTAEIGLKLAARIRTALKQNPVGLSSGTELPLCASVGIAAYVPGQSDFLTAERLMDAADKSMYIAKKSGRDRAHAHALNNV